MSEGIGEQIKKMFGFAGESSDTKDDTKDEKDLDKEESSEEEDENLDDGEGEDGEGEGEGGKGDDDGGEEEKTEREKELEARLKHQEERLKRLEASSGSEESTPFIPELSLSDVEYVATDADFEKALQSREDFNKVINTANAQTAAKIIEHLTKSLPPVIEKVALDLSQTTTLINNFWTSNKDLKKIPDVKKKVAKMYQEIETKNPHKTMEELFDQLAVDMRAKYLKGDKGGGKNGKQPPFGGGGRGQRPQGGKKGKESDTSIGGQLKTMARFAR